MAGKLSTYEKQLAAEIKNTPEEYLPNLLQIVRIFRESIMLKSAEASFTQGWAESLQGNTHPVKDLWDGIDAE